jgi:hypothetical protein
MPSLSVAADLMMGTSMLVPTRKPLQYRLEPVQQASCPERKSSQEHPHTVSGQPLI